MPTPLFEKGNSGGPGRPRGSRSGRAQVLGLLDKIFAESENIKIVEEALGKDFQKDPVKFFNKYAVALAPKDLSLQAEGEDITGFKVTIETAKANDTER